MAEFGARFVTRCGTLATQVPEEKEKETGGEGGIARGRGRPLVLRFAPDRRGWAATSKNRSAIFVEPGGSVHTPCSAEIKRDPQRIPFYFSHGGEGDSRIATITYCFCGVISRPRR